MAASDYGTDRSMEQMIDRFKVVFKSKRLVYKALEDSPEITELIAELNSDPVIKGLAEFGSLKPPTKKDLEKLTQALIEKPLLSVVICLPAASTEAQPTIIGFVTLVSRWERAAQIAICLSKDHQNQGYGREAIDWITDWAFLWGGVHRVAIGAIAFNTRALKLYRSIGWTEEACIRGAAWSDGKWHDLIDFSILDYEWKELRGIK